MKKLLSLLITAVMIISVMTVPAFAENSYGLVFSMNFEEMTAGDVFANKAGVGWKIPGSASDWTIETGVWNGATVEVSNFKGASDLCGKISFGAANGSATFNAMRWTYNPVKNGGSLYETRKGSTAYTFSLYMPDGVAANLKVSGYKSDVTDLAAEGTGSAQTTMLNTSTTGTNIATYSYTLDTTTSSGAGVGNVIERGAWNDFKFVINYSAHTYTLYVNGRKIAENRGLAYPNLLCNYALNLTTNNADAVAYIDNINYYTLSDSDTTAQVIYTAGAHGRIEPESEVTAVGQNPSFEITPDEGYEIESITYNGSAVSIPDVSGCTYQAPGLTSSGGVLAATFAPERTTANIFNVDFNGTVNGAAVSDGSLINASAANLYVNGGKNYASLNYNNGIYAGLSDESLAAKLSFPASDSDLVAALYSYVDKTKFTDIVTRPFSLSYKVKIPSGAYYRLGFRFNPDTSSSITIAETSGNNLKVNSYLKDGTVSSNIAFSNLTDGNAHELKYIFDPANYACDLYVDGKLCAENVGIYRDEANYLIHYMFSQFNNKKNEMTIYIDDVKSYTLTEKDVKAQVSYEAGEGGKITSSSDITAVGQTPSYTITPDEGYAINSVTYNGNTVTVSDASGFTFRTPALTSSGGTLTADFTELRAFKKIFGNDFETTETGSKPTTFTTAESANAMVYNDASISVVEESDGNNAVKITLPSSNANSSSNIYALINKNTFESAVSGPFALSYRLKMPAGQHMRMLIRRGSDNTQQTIFEQFANGGLNFYDFNFRSNHTLAEGEVLYNEITSPVTIADGKYHTVTIIFDPEHDCFDGYIDGRLIADNAGFIDQNNLYYMCLNIYHNDDAEIYYDDLAGYQLLGEDVVSQVSAEASGNGTVAANKAINKAGDTVIYTITPDAGNYVKSVTYNGAPVAAFSASGLTYETPSVTSSAVLAVEFGEYADENTPVLITAPYMIKTSSASYIFNKLLTNGADIAEFGVLYSADNPALGAGTEATIEIPFSKALTANNIGVDSNGYYGYEFINNTGAENVSYYVRAYAKVGENIYLGDIKHIDTAELDSVED